MSQDVWSERETTPDAIDAALRRLLRERHSANPGLAPSRVLNFIVVVDSRRKREVSDRLSRVGRYNGSRTVLCAIEDGRHALDARAVIAYEEPTKCFGVMREEVEIDMGPDHLSRLKTIIDPVVVSDLPTVLWCPHGHAEAQRALLGLVDVVLVDSDEEPAKLEALESARELLRTAYVVDLAWLRTTPWRERLASSFDPPERRNELQQVRALGVRHRPESTASALLMAGWMSSRLGWEPGSLETGNGAGMRATCRHRHGEVDVRLEPAEQEAPGLAGVTVTCADGFSLALDRSSGGLCAHRHSTDGRETTWRVLGASRGEAGILGEGVRQALLRDPTYGPALQSAITLCPP